MNIASMSIKEIQKLFDSAGALSGEHTLEMISQDRRAGVRRLYQQFCRQQALAEKEKIRLENLQLYEQDARRKGINLIAGVDEVGRGPLAGVVVAAAVILPAGVTIIGINDSKKLTASRRNELYKEIVQEAVCWSVGSASVEEIDEINILNASLLAMERAVKGLLDPPEFVLVDAVHIPGIKIPQLPIIKGDGLSISIAAASIIAKVTRDSLMEDYHRTFPQYGFASHKGYGTREHMEALRKHGPCPLHRKTFIRGLTATDDLT